MDGSKTDSGGCDVGEKAVEKNEDDQLSEDSDRRRLAVEKERNRSRFPVVTEIVDAFRAEFGKDVTVTYAREGDQEIGRRAE
jgi:hypothetical protein